MKTAFIYTDSYLDYDYGRDHPLKIIQLKLADAGCLAVDPEADRASGSNVWMRSRDEGRAGFHYARI